MKTLALIILLALTASNTFAQDSLSLRTATNHPMMYYVSLPKEWSKSKSWPVVFILEAAEKEFQKNALRFVQVRGNMPFILVAPINTNNGNQGRKDPSIFPYSKETWDYIDKVGDCTFNLEGIKQIMQDVERDYHADKKIYLTGFEAGAHDLWSVVFNHPEYLKAVVPVAGNFRNRCIPNQINVPQSSSDLPIRLFIGEKDELYDVMYAQWKEAKSLAQQSGFKNLTENIIPGEVHRPLPSEILNYFYTQFKSGN